MKLWIRTQDKKKLLEAENVWIDSKTYSNVNNYNTIRIEGEVKYYIMVDDNVVATYGSMDRCLTILDEIQTLLINKKKTKTETELSVRDCVVYELPKE